MGLAGQAAQFRKGHRVSEETHDEQPWISFKGQKDTQAEQGADNQVGENRQKKLHARILACLGGCASLGAVKKVKTLKALKR
jgi:hypothetical protein